MICKFTIFNLEKHNGDQDCNEPSLDDINTQVVLEDLSATNITDLSPEVEELHQKVSLSLCRKCIHCTRVKYITGHLYFNRQIKHLEKNVMLKLFSYIMKQSVCVQTLRHFMATELGLT